MSPLVNRTGFETSAICPVLGNLEHAATAKSALRAAGDDGASSPDAVARWLWERIGKR